ncbi:MAG: hypothetical protein ACLPY5_08895 [Candidatus Bathyarchaeia archaeon]
MPAETGSHNSLRTTIYLSLCIVLCGAFLGTNAVTASLCQITNISVNYQQPAPPNQQIQLSTVVSGICSPAEQQVFYTARVDIHDTARNQILSMASVPIGYLTLEQPNFVVTVPNVVTTPNVVSSRQLAVVVYLFANFELVANGIDTSTVDNISVQVGTVQITTMSSVQTTNATVTTTTSSTMAQSTSTINEASSVEPIWQQVQSIGLLTAAAIITILTLAFLFKPRKSRSKSAS